MRTVESSLFAFVVLVLILDSMLPSLVIGLGQRLNAIDAATKLDEWL